VKVTKANNETHGSYSCEIQERIDVKKLCPNIKTNLIEEWVTKWAFDVIYARKPRCHDEVNDKKTSSASLKTWHAIPFLFFSLLSILFSMKF
jgi:hypothetical protein